MAAFDLTTRLGTYLDRHLVFPLLEFLSNKQIYDEKDLLKGKLDLLSNTNMLDFAMEVHQQLYPDDDMPESILEKRSTVIEDIKVFHKLMAPFFSFFEKEEVQNEIVKSRDNRILLELLNKEDGFKEEMLDNLYNFAKFQYECGNYSGTAMYLNVFRMLVQPTDKNYLNCLWGLMASDILMQNWDNALEGLNRLRDYIDDHNFGSSLQSLQQRTWLIHWSLFVFFNHVRGRDLIIDMFLYQQQYLNAIQTICPHVLRYLTSAVVTNKFKRSALKDLVKVIQQESYTYRDPITEFIEHLYVNFDFDAAQKKLRECEEVIRNDFFLVACLDDFIDNARLMIFETFCRIHQCISINMLAEKLNMTPELAEHWIVNLIRNAHLDAKIDSRLGHVVMGIQAVSPYDQLIEKTKNLTFKANHLQQTLEKRLSSSRNQDLSSHWAAHDF